MFFSYLTQVFAFANVSSGMGFRHQAAATVHEATVQHATLSVNT